jgi:mono/diheme cytochrome c family protein
MTVCIIACAFGPCPTSAAQSEARPGRDWAVDPTSPGENLPPVGRSLFDHLFTRSEGSRKVYDVPFPFSAVLKKLESEVQPASSGASPIKTVLIPLGRSLQRTAAAPQFFAFPRVVVTVDTEPRTSATSAGMLLKDRIYLGYQEKAEVIEVISYNEAAGRFEFQVVKDYRAGGIPKVFYANRTICTACHQNAAPIFPRQVWDETNANRPIAAALLKERRSFYGIEPDRGVDIPYALDNATDRANLFSAYQLLWRDGCEVVATGERAARCRAALFVAALQYRLSGGQQFDASAARMREGVVPILTWNAREYWPGGLRLPNPDLPNRDPLVVLAQTGRGVPTTAPAETYRMANNVNVPAAFDPLQPRPPIDAWQIRDGATLSRLVAGLAEFITDSDARTLSAQLSSESHRAQVASVYESDCELARSPRSATSYRLDFKCSTASAAARSAKLEGRLYVEGPSRVNGSIDRLVLADTAQAPSDSRDLDVRARAIVSRGAQRETTLQLARNGALARRGDGNRVESVQLGWEEGAASVKENGALRGRAVVTVVNDFDPVIAAVERMVGDTIAGKIDAFSGNPFRRAALMPPLLGELRAKPLAWCCVSDTGMPTPVMDVQTTTVNAKAEADAKPVALQPFFRYCATCHQTNERTPPNFLQGSANAVTSNIAHCAERLYVRLSMWQIAPEQRPKTPMPPQYALYGFHSSPQAWRDSAELAALRTYVERALQAEKGKAPRPEELLARGYENLRACLPEAS